MPVLQAISDRRSIREYQPGAVVTDEQLRNMLEAAMMAPSAHDGRPWEFVVVRDRARLETLRGLHPYADMLRTASMAVVVCFTKKAGDTESQSFVPQDCGAATENLMLQAAADGLGTCWCGVHPREPLIEAVRDALDIPKELTPFNIIAVGVAAKTPERRGRYEGSKVHYR